MGILDIDLNKINLDATFYDEDEPETAILVRYLAWHIKFEKRKALIRVTRRINTNSVES